MLTLTLPLKSWTEKAYAAARARNKEHDAMSENKEDASAHNQRLNDDSSATHPHSGATGSEHAAVKSGKDNAANRQEGDFEKTLRENLRKQSEKSKEGKLPCHDC